MASTTFVDGETLIEASWLNDVNAAVYTPGTTTAADIANVPTGNIAATDVQAALNELDTEKVATSAIGISVQAYDATLAALAGTLTAANKIPYATALNTAGELDLSTSTSLGTSDTTLSSQKAVKTYVDTQIASIHTLTAETAKSASGTSVDFGSLPSWARKITILLSDVRTNGTSQIMIQAGTGTPTTSGYVGAVMSAAASTPVVATHSAGFKTMGGGIASTQIAYARIELVNIDSLTWVASISYSEKTTPYAGVGTGSITLASALDMVRITTVNGTDAFAAGTINVMLE